MKRTVEVPLCGNLYRGEFHYCDICTKYTPVPKKIIMDSCILSPFVVCDDCNTAVREFIKRRHRRCVK